MGVQNRFGIMDITAYINQKNAMFIPEAASRFRFYGYAISLLP